MEMVHSDWQLILDDYLVGYIEEDAFLEAIDYENTWGFHWPPFRDIFMLCRERRIPILAINTEPEEGARDGILQRDFHAADIIVRESLANPGRLIFVFDGDLHVATDHLPLIVNAGLQKWGATRTQTIVHQNASPMYWKLAEDGLERLVDVVRVQERCYCVMSATPLTKLQSYLSWQQNRVELDAYVEPGWRFGDENAQLYRDYSEQVHQIVRTIAGFLKIESPHLDNFTVYTTVDLDFLQELESDPETSRELLRQVKRQIAANESYFIPGVNIIYLADHSLDTAAEEATHFLNCVLAGFDPEPRKERDAFYYQAVREAIAFFGSRVIDHKRYCLSEKEMQAFLKEMHGKRLRPEGRKHRELCRLCLKHLEAERCERAARGNGARRRGPRREPFFGLAPNVKNAVTHTLGYILGDKLHVALLADRMTKVELRALFSDPLPSGRAEKVYLELMGRFDDVEHDMPSPRLRF
jgi:hypothetical protein